MLESSISTILIALIIGIPRQGKFLTWDLICLTREVWISDQGGGLFYNQSNRGLHCSASPYKT